MCEYCRGKTIMSINVNLAEWITYGGGYTSEKTTFDLIINDNYLMIGRFPKGYRSKILNHALIKYCPFCGIELR